DGEQRKAVQESPRDELREPGSHGEAGYDARQENGQRDAEVERLPAGESETLEGEGGSGSEENGDDHRRRRHLDAVDEGIARIGIVEQHTKPFEGGLRRWPARDRGTVE